MAKQPNNFLQIPEESTDYKKSPIVIASYPFEKTTSYAKGTKGGPKAIIDASSQVEFYDPELKEEPWKVGIHTATPLSFEKLSSEQAVKTITTDFAKFLDDKKFPIGLGGEHTVSAGTIAAAAKRFPNLSVLQIDAHADLRDSYEGSPWSHASVMRRIHPLVKKLVGVGIRSVCSEEVAFAQAHPNITLIYDHERRRTQWLEQAIDPLTENVFVTVDVDGFTPELIPATGTPEPGGLSWYEGLDLLRAVFQKKRVVACDVVELMPDAHHHSSSFTVAKLVYKLIGYWKKYQR